MAGGRDKAWYYDRKAAGKCYKCKSDAEPGKATCRHHLDHQAALRKDQRARAKEAKRCTTCLIAKPANRKSTCQPCIERRLRNQQADRDDRRRKGICISCPKRALKGKQLCRKCLRAKNAYTRQYQRRRQLENMSKGMCSKCGRRPPRDRDVVLCRVCLAQAAAYRKYQKEIREYEHKHKGKRRGAVEVPATEAIHAAP